MVNVVERGERGEGRGGEGRGGEGGGGEVKTHGKKQQHSRACAAARKQL
jgi:hypothetical protein